MNAVMGDLISTKARHRGVAGFVVDGLIRDLPAILALGDLPVFARDVTPIGPLHRGPGEIGGAICAGGIVVNPGDVIVADLNGVVVVPRLDAQSVLEHVRYTAAEQGWEMPWANSFPSGHTTAAATLAVGLLFVVPARHRLGASVVGFLLTAAVGFSVMVLSWHYPSDVLGALLVVGAWAFAILAVMRFREDRVAAVSDPSRSPRDRWAVSTE